MKKIVLTGALLGSVVLMGNLGGAEGSRLQPQSAGQQVQQATAAAVESQLLPSVTLDTVNGISLFDGKRDVIDKRGIPLTITQDPLFPGTEVYDYGSMSVGFTDGQIDYVSIPAEADIFFIDGKKVLIRPEQIRQVFGDPDYIAEDGLVYQRGDRLLKVYLDTKASRIKKINYYHLSGV